MRQHGLALVPILPRAHSTRALDRGHWLDADARVLAGQLRLASAIAGGRPLYEKPADRRFGHDAPEKRQEADMLLDPASRLGDGDVYMPAQRT